MRHKLDCLHSALGGVQQIHGFWRGVAAAGAQPHFAAAAGARGKPCAGKDDWQQLTDFEDAGKTF
jgi:hypothetical protein